MSDPSLIGNALVALAGTGAVAAFFRGLFSLRQKQAGYARDSSASYTDYLRAEKEKAEIDKERAEVEAEHWESRARTYRELLVILRIQLMYAIAVLERAGHDVAEMRAALESTKDQL